MESYLDIFSEICRYLILVALLFFFFTKHKGADRRIKIGLIVAFIVDAMMEFSDLLLGDIGVKGTMIAIFHMYDLILPLIVFYIFYEAFEEPLFKKLIVIVSVIFSISIITLFTKMGLSTMYTAPYVTGQILIIILSVGYFFNMIYRMNVDNLKNHYFFWINSALLFYHGSTYFVSLFDSTIRAEESDLFLYSWLIQLTVSALYVLIIIKGTWTTRLRSS